MSGWGLVRTKREWCPEWLWWLAAHADRRCLWIAEWLSELSEEESE